MKTNSLLLLFVLIIPTNLFAQSPVFEWGLSTGGTGFEVGNSVVMDDFGFIYSIGSFSGVVDFDPGPEVFNLTSNGVEDIFVQKLDSLGDLVWAQSFGGSQFESHGSIAIDANNDLYLTGTFGGTVDFDPTSGSNILTSNGFSDIFILKLDATGNLYWAKSIGGVNSDYPSQINVDEANNVVLTGNYQASVDFDPGPSELFRSSNGGRDIFILKMDQDANFLWVQSIGGNSFDNTQAITFDASNNLYLTGYFSGTVDFNPGTPINNLISNGLSDVFLLKLTSDGQYIWSKSFGGNDIDLGATIKVDHSNDLIAIGDFRGSVDFSPNTSAGLQTSEGEYDTYILKLNSAGDFIWVETLSSAENVFARDFAIDQFNNYYITGEFSSSINFEVDDVNHTINSSNFDAFVFKLDAFGDFRWGHSIGGNAYDAGSSILIDSSNNIILAGSFEGTADIDPGDSEFDLTSNGISDFFITKWSQDFFNPTITVPLKELNIIAYPNPVIDFITIDKKNNSEIQLKILNVEGKIVASKKLIDEETIIHLSNLIPGLYFMNFEIDNFTATKEFYKN